jgi:hypothetical protein
MRGQDAKGSIALGDWTYFVPANPRFLLTGTGRRWNVWSGAYLDSDDFEREDLLLMQDRKGGYWWAFFENIFKQDSKMRLHPCSLNHSQADCIVKKRVLLIADSDLRLSDFSLLCRTDKPPTFDETLEKFDLAARHLASTREVNIFRIGPDGKRTPDEVRTADYRRAKADIRRNPADTRNMRRFCNRQGSNGEGPSNLDSRVCHGYVRPSWLSSTPGGPSYRPSRSNSSPTLGKPDIAEISFPVRPYRKHSTAYHIMKLARVPDAKLQAEQYKYDLKHARREKRPEGYVPPPRWTTVVKYLREFWPGRQRKKSADTSLSSENSKTRQQESKKIPNRQYPSSDSSEYSSCNRLYERSISASLVCDEDISPLTLPAPTLEALRAAQCVVRLETFPSAEIINGASSSVRATDCVKRTCPAAEIIDGVKSEGHALQPRHDSLGEGITGGCESKAAFADPGVSTAVVREDVKRCWVENGGWEWIFNEGMG